MIRKIILWGIFGILALSCIIWLGLLIVNASRTEKMRYGAARLRADRARHARGPILIGVGGCDGPYSQVLDGIQLACDSLNSKGGVLGRTIELVPRDDKQSVIQGRQVAQGFSDNPDIIAVIGHPTSAVSIPASIIYQYYGILMLSPMATSPKLTEQGRNRVFRNIPNDNQIGRHMAEYAHKRGFSRIAIYYLQDDFGRGLSAAFEKRAEELGLTIQDRLFYDNTYRPRDFRRALTRWERYYQIDAIFLAGLLPQAAQFVVQARAAGFRVPILAGETLDRSEYLRLAGAAAENTIVASIFSPNEPRPAVEAFRSKFTLRYSKPPGPGAAQGYDALRLLAHAISVAKSCEPDKIAAALRQVKGWPGVTGPHTFNQDGDVVDKPILIKVVQGGSFRLVPNR